MDADGIRQLLQGFVVEDLSVLIFVGVDLVDGRADDDFTLLQGFLRGRKQVGQALSQWILCHYDPLF